MRERKRMANSSKLTREEISAYIGTERTNILDGFSQSKWEKFQGYKISPKKSYYVRGNIKALKEFEAYFLFLCGFEKPFFKQYQIDNYASILSAPIGSDVDDLGIDQELIIIHVHNAPIGIGNTEAWVFSTLLNKITSRNRTGNVTLILSERKIAAFKESGELINIDLGGAVLVNPPKTEGTQEGTTDQQNSPGNALKGMNDTPML